MSKSAWSRLNSLLAIFCRTSPYFAALTHPCYLPLFLQPIDLAAQLIGVHFLVDGHCPGAGQLLAQNAAPPELRDAMDLAYLTGQRLADTIKMAGTDIIDDCLLVRHNKRSKWLRTRLWDGEAATGLRVFLDGLLERRVLAGIRTSTLLTNVTGLRMSAAMLRNR
ncbi:hypothetical protein [Pseudomonas oryzihabitans]|uniref:Uncharacterized protein n=1 Tax=Pseudomonas oryzihabitans TaxID=47885 RepID=A0AAJ2BPM5_9PSED|nr:hypothetical protein [Pseudomonas psychrotolerans]MDR6237020.1 hypothetical protein [Pseudomonas psychrotolerans]